MQADGLMIVHLFSPSVTLHGEKYKELTGQQLEAKNMEEPLVVAGKTFEDQRISASRKKAELVNQRNRHEGEIDNIKDNIDKLELEASRESRFDW